MFNGGANPTIKSYNTTNSIRVQIIFPFCKNVLAYYKASVVAVNFKVVGLGSD
jgi:hypothetical protein